MNTRLIALIAIFIFNITTPSFGSAKPFFDTLIQSEKALGVKDSGLSYYNLHPKKSRTAILYIHDYAANPSECHFLTRYLYFRGFDVFAIRLSGHGTVAEDLKTIHWKDWMASATSPFHILKKQYDHVVVCGSGLGSIIAARLAADESADGLIAIAPPMVFIEKGHYVGTSMAEFLDKLKVDVGYSQIDIPKYHQHIYYTKHPTTAGLQYRKFVKATKSNLKKVTCPTLVLQSKTDKVVSQSSPNLFLNYIRSENKSIIWTGDEHSLILTPNPKAFQSISDFCAAL